MTDHDDLLKAITASPDDDTLRLAYADFVQEHEEYGGESLAQAIRFGLAAWGTVVYRNDGLPVPGDPPAQYRNEWFSKWPAPGSSEYITAYEGAYFALKWFLPPPQARSRCEVRLHIGFPAELTVPAKWWLEHADSIVKKCPALTVKPHFSEEMAGYSVSDLMEFDERDCEGFCRGWIRGKKKQRRIRSLLERDFLILCCLEWPEVRAFLGNYDEPD